jgi:hypothetical protein
MDNGVMAEDYPTPRDFGHARVADCGKLGSKSLDYPLLTPNFMKTLSAILVYVYGSAISAERRGRQADGTYPSGAIRFRNSVKST